MTAAARASRLYCGLVVHARLRPREHRLRKRIPMVLFDLDELPTLGLRLLAVDRFAAFSLEARHHLAGDRTPLKVQVERRLAGAGLETGGAVRLLCMPAVLGQVFNPISVYFCHARDGTLSAILYEVNNTFGGRYAYMLPVERGREAGTVRHGCAKTFHVSPFMDMDLRYAFTVSPPGERVAVAIQVSDAEGTVLTASFAGAAEPLTDAALARVLLRHPLLMLEVLGAIHWEALKLLLKGLRLRPDPTRGRAPAGPMAPGPVPGPARPGPRPPPGWR